jgi:predicted nucleic acid-binding protein
MGMADAERQKGKKHTEASQLFCNHISRNRLIYTTDYVLDETFTLFFKRLSSFKAQSSADLILNAIYDGQIQLERISPDRFQTTCEFRKRFQDKPSISFTDLSSMVVMQELDIQHILTGDAHFTHVNLGFLVIPEIY